MAYPTISISKKLTKNGRTIATAESCTGGLLANMFTNLPGSSQYFLVGIAAYSNQAKTSLLKIPAAVIKQHGAVSSEVSKLMAQNIRKISSSDYAIGITGIAGPGGGSPKKPLGTVFISLAVNSKTITKRFRFTGTRLEIKRKTALKAVSMLNALIP